MNLYDWRKAFDMQCPKLGLESFIKNGVRPSLLPVLKKFLQNRKMTVKWHNKFSTERSLNGGGPQGGTLGIWKYLSQTNKNLEFVDEDDQFKFVDDASALEIINLLSIGIASYNFKQHVHSKIPSHNQFIPKENLQSQQYLEKLNTWSNNQKMQLNLEKTKLMLFNFSKNNQFTTFLSLEDHNIEIVDKIKLLGTTIISDLKWD